MKSILRHSMIGAFLVGSSCLSHGGVTVQVIADNDFAVLVGTSTSVTRLIFQNDSSWPNQVDGASTVDFDFAPGETSVYLVAMGAGGPENIGGNMNGVDITTVNVSQSSDFSGFLSDWGTTPPDRDAGTYSVTLSQVASALPSLTWGAPTIDDEGGVGNNVNGSAFKFDEGTAVIYRFAGEDIGATITPAPEPGASLLALASSVLILGRRRR